MSGKRPQFFALVNTEKGVAAVADRRPLQPAALPVDGWSITSIVAAGLDVSVYHVAPRAFYGSHVGPFDCICIVAEGEGSLFLTDAEGRELEHVSCRKGDAYLQCANTLHGFRNGPRETVLIYVRVA
jgi:hypothetical protein